MDKYNVFDLADSQLAWLNTITAAGTEGRALIRTGVIQNHIRETFAQRYSQTMTEKLITILGITGTQVCQTALWLHLLSKSDRH